MPEELAIAKTNLAAQLEKSSQKPSRIPSEQTKKSHSQLQKEVTNLLKKNSRSSKKTTDENEVEEREKIIWKVRRYLSSKKFGEYLTKELGIKYSQAQLRKLKLTSLRNLLHRIRIAVDMKNVDAIYDKMVFHGTFVVEKALSPIYNIDGFTENLHRNEEFQCGMEKLKIEAELPHIPPVI